MFCQHNYKNGKPTSLTFILDQVYATIMESEIFRCTTKTFCAETLKFLPGGFYWYPSKNRDMTTGMAGQEKANENHVT